MLCIFICYIVSLDSHVRGLQTPQKAQWSLVNRICSYVGSNEEYQHEIDVVEIKMQVQEEIIFYLFWMFLTLDSELRPYLDQVDAVEASIAKVIRDSKFSFIAPRICSCTWCLCSALRFYSVHFESSFLQRQGSKSCQSNAGKQQQNINCQLFTSIIISHYW